MFIFQEWDILAPVFPEGHEPSLWSSGQKEKEDVEKTRCFRFFLFLPCTYIDAYPRGGYSCANQWSVMY